MLIIVLIWLPLCAALISKTGNVIQSVMACQKFFSTCPEQPFWGFQGKRWVGLWVNRSSTCVLRVWSYSRFSAALERSVAEYLEQCLRSRVKMHWKRWKQLLIFVSSARGGEAAVCRAGKNTSSLSSVTHQLKKWISSKTFYFCWLNQFWRNSWAFPPLFTFSPLTSKGFWKLLVNKLRSIARDFPLRTFWLSVQVFPILSSRGLKLAPLSHWLTNGSCRANALCFVHLSMA